MMGVAAAVWARASAEQKARLEPQRVALETARREADKLRALYHMSWASETSLSAKVNGLRAELHEATVIAGRWRRAAYGLAVFIAGAVGLWCGHG